ncbi:hypothetical protein [Pseudomonas sp. P9_31]|uniref:hypothetical protein n=1 Tax=Pseudomonas sp. P9_31 TaxID=3043448 RepID=UPI002A37000A|nr:hypothetical protein [Pseudomonas sp. P9_31]WPN56692.1 hypothetical protein QMK51_21500 [Pseudomonas sp. P9_31]
MRVVAAPSLRVPMELEVDKHIGADAVDVPSTSYYRRRIASGELLPAEPESAEVLLVESPSAEQPDSGAKKSAKGADK